MNNTTYKLSDVKNLLLVDDAMWKNFITHTKTIEDKFYEIDFIVNEMLTAELEPVVLTIGNKSSDFQSSDLYLFVL